MTPAPTGVGDSCAGAPWNASSRVAAVVNDAAASSSMSSSPSAFPRAPFNATAGNADHQDPLLVYPGVPYPDLTQLPGVCSAFVLLYLIVMVLSLVGNAMVCYTVLSDRKMHTAVNYYMVNLAACDLAVGAFVLPVKLMELAGPASWSLMTDWLCTALLYSQTVVVFASVLTLVATCLERYLAIVYPLVSRAQQSKARAKRILLGVWAAPCLLASPFLQPARAESDTLWSQYGSISRRSCLITLDPSFRRGYYTSLFVLMYLLPLAFIGWTCARIARCLLKGIALTRQGSLRRQEANRRKVAKMVMVVAAAFALSWTPYFLVSMWTQFGTNYLEKQNYFFTMLSINLLAFINSCVNPFIYAAMSRRFRGGFRRILFPISCAGSCQSGTRPVVPACSSSFRLRLHRLVNGTSLLSTASSGSQSDSLPHSVLPGTHPQHRVAAAALKNMKQARLATRSGHTGGAAATLETVPFSLESAVASKEAMDDTITEQHRRALSDSVLTRHNGCCCENGSLPSVAKKLPEVVDPGAMSKRRGTTQ
ncbi:galanin receptor type 1-like isoform X2 [Dermacentor albipictus]|uniref:galanin receptor type 1-like isoform X2 n=1 Tax=Dermacentor albipictus TaxID=60249 RepID=UPI0031FC01F5